VLCTSFSVGTSTIWRAIFLTSRIIPVQQFGLTLSYQHFEQETQMPPTQSQITIPLAERHEALWLRLEKLHKDITAIAAKKPDGPVGDAERSVAEGLIRECRPFIKRPIDAMPAAALHFAGLCVQLGQFLARLEDFENRHAYWHAKLEARVWRVAGGTVPVRRLRQELAPYEHTTYQGRDLRSELVKRMDAKEHRVFEAGFAAGRAARQGPPSGFSPGGAGPQTGGAAGVEDIW
jgi:hypothetical protein